MQYRLYGRLKSSHLVILPRHAESDDTLRDLSELEDALVLWALLKERLERALDSLMEKSSEYFSPVSLSSSESIDSCISALCEMDSLMHSLSELCRSEDDGIPSSQPGRHRPDKINFAAAAATASWKMHGPGSAAMFEDVGLAFFLCWLRLRGKRFEGKYEYVFEKSEI